MINKKKLMMTSVAAVAAAGGANVQALPMQWNVGTGANGHWYELERQSLSWEGAKQNALDKGGYLATITSAEENAAVNYLVAVVENLLLDNNLDIAVWLGGTDSAAEGAWKWSDGPEGGQQFWQGDKNGSATGGAYTNWADDEPNDFLGGEDFLGMYVLGGKWNDFGNHGVHGLFSVIEYDDNPIPGGEIPVPGTAALALLGLAGVAACRRRKKQSKQG